MQILAQDLGQIISPILIIDRERLFSESNFGKGVAALLSEERDRLEAETRLIEAELEAEELALTEARATLSQEEFRASADAFDAKVQMLRAERDDAQEKLVAQIEEAQLRFLEQVNPILARLMQEAGASILMDRRAVIFSATSIDITAQAIARIDAALAQASEAGNGQGENPEAGE
ncbi:MAG: OmpH family outer membrane protein [Rhodobacteraceae bacterium]|nr:OmpH family outer membrane protein [Paracoccaceae bacterium]